MVPALNPDLRLKPFDVGGYSERFIVDIAGRSQFEVSGLVYHILRLIDGKRGTEEIAEILNLTFNGTLSCEIVDRIVNDYFVPRGFVECGNMDSHLQKERTFLHLKLSLASQTSLRPLTNMLRFMFAWPVFVAMVIVSALVPLYTFWSLGSGIESVGNVRGVDLLAVYGIVLATAFFHELGHASACAHFGAKHGDVGIALYLFFPVLYADVSDVWNLDRRQRIVVDGAGIYFQMLCVPVLCLIYLASANTIVLCAIYATYLTIVTALNPFLRFDGYWLVSDFFGVPNLRKKSLESIRSVLKKFFGKTDRRVSARRNKGIGTAIFVYGVLSIIFFLLFFFQLGFFVHSNWEKSASIIVGLLGERPANARPIGFSDVVNAIDISIPSLLVLAAFLAWVFAAIEYAGRELKAYHRKRVSNRNGLR